MSNIKLQRTGAVLTEDCIEPLPAADLERQTQPHTYPGWPSDKTALPRIEEILISPIPISNQLPASLSNG
jgi:hypothetical protein